MTMFTSRHPEAHRRTTIIIVIIAALLLLTIGGVAAVRGVQDAHRDALADCRDAEQTMKSEVLGRDNLVDDHPELKNLSTSQVQDETAVTDLQSLIASFSQPSKDLACHANADTASLKRTTQRIKDTARQARKQAEDFRTAYKRFLDSQADKEFADAKDSLAAAKTRGEQIYEQYQDSASPEYLNALRKALDSTDDSDASTTAQSINTISTAINDVLYR